MNLSLLIILELEQSLVIQEKVGNRMRAYGEPSDKSDTFIIIEPNGVPDPRAPVSDSFLAESHLIQIDVQGPNHTNVNTVANEVRRVMWRVFNMSTIGVGLDTYFEETKRFLDSRTYEGAPQKLYYQNKIM